MSKSCLDLQAVVPLEHLFHMQNKDNTQGLHTYTRTWVHYIAVKQMKIKNPVETLREQLIFICMEFTYKIS